MKRKEREMVRNLWQDKNEKRRGIQDKEREGGEEEGKGGRLFPFMERKRK